MTQSLFPLLPLHFLILLPTITSLPDLNPLQIQSLLPPTNISTPTTIPAFPEQSDVAGCPLNLPNELFHGIKSACGQPKSGKAGQHLHRSKCCPVLAAWLYSAYSDIVLGRAGRVPQTTSYNDLPLLPDDSETCVDNLQKGLRNQGIELVKPNETCDVVYCYCGIRLHPFSCPAAFSVSPENGKVVGGRSVEKLERNCLSSEKNGVSGLGGCSKCLKSLYRLNEVKTKNPSKSEERSSKMQFRDCEHMGLTWLLAKNRSAYIHTVSNVLRAFMMSTPGSNPRSCSLNSDGLPLAVDSSEMNAQSSSHINSPLFVSLVSLCLTVVASLYYLPAIN